MPVPDYQQVGLRDTKGRKRERISRPRKSIDDDIIGTIKEIASSVDGNKQASELRVGRKYPQGRATQSEQRLIELRRPR